MKATPQMSVVRRFDVGESKPITALLRPDGTIVFSPTKKGGRSLTTTIERVYFSALRTRELNRVRDRERAARRRLSARKGVAR